MIDGIVPRWEWRGFGDRVRDACERLAALTPEREEESDEIYVLGSPVRLPSRLARGCWTSSASSGCATTGSSSGSRL